MSVGVPHAARSPAAESRMEKSEKRVGHEGNKDQPKVSGQGITL